MIYQYAPAEVSTQSHTKLHPEAITINQAVFVIANHEVTISQESTHTTIFCNCDTAPNKLCIHRASILIQMIRQEELMLFFDPKKRQEKLKRFAFDYGLEGESELEKYFKLSYIHGRLDISPVSASLTPVTKEFLDALKDRIIPIQKSEKISPAVDKPFVVFSPNSYYKHLQTHLCTSAYTKTGKPKNPINKINAQEEVWQTHEPEYIKFLMGIGRMQKRESTDFDLLDMEALRAIIKNAPRYHFYYHKSVKSNFTASSLQPLEIKVLYGDIHFEVSRFEETYAIKAILELNGERHEIDQLGLHLQCFIQVYKTWYLIDSLPTLNLIKLLKKHEGQLVVSTQAFQEFRLQFLDKLEDHLKINYTFIPKATDRQIAINGYLSDMERLIYLTDHGSHVMIIPVMRYGDVEISVRTNRHIYGKDAKGNEFLVDRNIAAESSFMALLVKQHDDFNEQLENPLDHFYLHKRNFLDEDWFIPVFEAWRQQDIRIFGFNELEGNKFSPYKISVDIKVSSGLNWFNAQVSVKFGSKKAALKKVQIAVKNKSKYVELDDGTFGLIPKEWLDRFEAYFLAGDISEDDFITIPKFKYTEVDRLFDDEMIEMKSLHEIRSMRERASNFTQITSIKVPKSLNGSLRSYQIEGLNWLNFLDDYNFGGCLADDMGLGKSVQIIAFILTLLEKKEKATHLLVVPTTLLFNWNTEFEKFAPVLNSYTQHGTDRFRSIDGLEKYDVIITTYNSLVSDIGFLRKFHFDYVFLDEAQYIKNPESQRYKAICMLSSRNRIAITGTPVENNTFDLYSIFSFVNPGLLASKRFFKELYAIPIDQFKDQRRAKELEQKISPFLLRRTKTQVAQELPSKTEMTLYCQMEHEQKETYLAYEKEFRDFISATDAEELEKSPTHVLRGLTKLRQICNSTRLLKSDEVLGKKTSSKLDMLMEQIETNAPHHKMVIFSQFVSMLDLIKEALEKTGIKYVMLTGSTHNREAVINEFRNDSDVRVALISLKAGGTGLNLVEASYVYLIDPWWNPAVENQAIDRVHRIGQENNVTAIRLICPNTVEEKIVKLQQTKNELTQKLISESNSFFNAMDKKKLLSLLQ